jgi:hypothetical protein
MPSRRAGPSGSGAVPTTTWSSAIRPCPVSMPRWCGVRPGGCSRPRAGPGRSCAAMPSAGCSCASRWSCPLPRRRGRCCGSSPRPPGHRLPARRPAPWTWRRPFPAPLRRAHHRPRPRWRSSPRRPRGQRQSSLRQWRRDRQDRKDLRLGHERRRRRPRRPGCRGLTGQESRERCRGGVRAPTGRPGHGGPSRRPRRPGHRVLRAGPPRPPGRRRGPRAWGRPSRFWYRSRAG